MTGLISLAKDTYGYFTRSPESVAYTDSSESIHDPEMHPDTRRWMVKYQETRQKHDNLKREFDVVSTNLGRYKAGYAKLVDNFNSLVDKCNSLENKYNGKKDELARTTQMLAERERALERAEAKNKEMKDLLDTRTAELTAFQDFAPSAEQVTDVRVAEMVNELNYEIGQTASSLSDDYTEADPSPGEDVKETLHMLGKRVGRGVTVIVSHAGRGVEQDIAMQIAFQACMSVRAHSIIQRWCFGRSADEDLLIDVWRQISEGEQVHVSRKWRSLARQYGRWTRRDRPKAEGKYVADIKELLADVLIASGHATDKTSALSSIHAKVGAHIVEVVRLAFELNEVLGQKLGAYEMETLRVYSKEPYDSDEMVDSYSTSDPIHDDNTRRRLVLCTTDLGLLRIMNGETDILVKPKVALDTLVVSHAP